MDMTIRNVTLYINEEEEFAVLAQCYFSSKDRQEAPQIK